MSKIFLTSNTGFCEKINGVRFAKTMDDTNGIVSDLKQSIKNFGKIVFIASDPDDHVSVDVYSKLLFESFKLSGLGFMEMSEIDNSFSGDIQAEISSADVVFLMGGSTPIQMEYFERINLRNILKNYDGIIIGMSAGAINLANEVVYTPEFSELNSDIKTTWRGLKKTRINIEPHFINGELSEEEVTVRNNTLGISKTHRLYAICDGTHIVDDGENVIVCGEAYILKDGQVEQVCENGKRIRII